MCALHTAGIDHCFPKAIRRLSKYLILCAGLLAMATVNASTHIAVIDSFNGIDDLLRTTPRSVPAPGTDFTQINSLNGPVVADRLITLTDGNLALTGSALEMFGDSSAEINITYPSEVDWAFGGAGAFDFHFTLSDGTDVVISASVTTATGVVNYLPLTFIDDGAHQAFFDFDIDIGSQADFSRVNSFNFFIDTFGGQNTFSLDAVGTTAGIIPIPAAVWLFASAVGLLGWVQRRTT